MNEGITLKKSVRPMVGFVSRRLIGVNQEKRMSRMVVEIWELRRRDNGKEIQGLIN